MFDSHTSQSPHFLKSTIFKASLIALIFFCCELFRTIYLSPSFDGHGDASYKWDLARSLANGDLRAFDSTSHHSLRWGGWLLSYLAILLFGDGLSIYLLSAVLPAALGGIIFSILVSREFGILVAAVFVFLWMIDPQLYARTYTLMPSGATLLPLALCLALFTKASKPFAIRILVLLAAVCFWAYGVKETNLFFVPAMLYLIYQNGGFRHVLVFSSIGVALYFVESTALWWFTQIDHPFGRLYELVYGSAKHIALMNSDNLQAQLAAYYDAGVSYRFYGQTTKYHSVLYFLAAGASIYNLAVRSGSSPFELANVTSVFYLSYFFINGFFVNGSFEPMQPLRARYLVPLIPLALILVMAIVLRSQKMVKSSWLIAWFALSWFFLSEPINWAIKKLNQPPANLYTMHANYLRFGELLDSADCVYNRVKRQLNIAHRWVPQDVRGDSYNEYVAAKVEKIDTNLYVKKLSPNCESNIIMHGAGFSLELRQ